MLFGRNRASCSIVSSHKGNIANNNRNNVELRYFAFSAEVTSEKCTFYSFSVDFCKCFQYRAAKNKMLPTKQSSEERSRPVLARTIEMLRKGCCN